MKARYLTLTSLVVLTIASQPVRADSLADIGDLPGAAVETFSYGLSADGTTVVGGSRAGVGLLEAFRWTQAGGMVGLGNLTGGFGTSYSNAVNADGSVVVGQSDILAGVSEAFRWTQAGGMVGLGDLAGGSVLSTAYGVSGDGTIVVGYSESANGYEAFRWTQAGGMVGLGDLAGGSFSSNARGINSNGTVIIGDSESAGGTEAFRWTQAGGMVGLGDLAGGLYDSRAYGISDDGNIIVGYGSSTNGNEAMIWTQAGGMVGLGDLAGGAYNSGASAISGNGNVVVGYAEDGSGSVAFIWTQADGMRSLASVLQANGVDLTGWVLESASGINTTGSIISGGGTFGGNVAGFIANVTTGGLTTPADLGQGVSSGVVPGQQSQSVSVNAIGQSLFAATRAISVFEPLSLRQDTGVMNLNLSSDIAPAAGDEEYSAPILSGVQYSSYLVGSVGVGHDNNFNNYDLNGTLGMTVQFDRELAVGFGVLESQLASETNHGGEARLDAQGGTVIAAYKGDNGLRLYGSSFIAHLSSETERAYLNGGGTSESRGKTTGLGYGAALRAGYEFQIDEQNSVMPYVEVQGSKSSLGAYTETGGAFPASFGKSKGTQVTSRVGASVEHKFSNDVTIGTSVAWAHRVKDDSDPLSVSLTGFSGNLNSGGAGDKDWAEASASATWNVSADTMISAELSGRSGRTQESAVSMSVGVKYSF